MKNTPLYMVNRGVFFMIDCRERGADQTAAASLSPLYRTTPIPLIHSYTGT